MMLLVGMALTVIAFTAPTIAQAEVTLTEEGVPLEAGAKVTATSTNPVITFDTYLLECAEVTLHYKVEVNDGSHVVLVPVEPHNTTANSCRLNTGIGIFPIGMTNTGTGALTIDTWGTATAPTTLTINVPALAVHCTITGNVPFRASHTQADVLTVETGNVLTTVPNPPCPNGEAHGSFTIETSDGKALQLDFVKTT